MTFIELLLIGVALSMDAFAVSICKGVTASARNLKNGVLVGLYFGVFQALMPTLGFFLGNGVYQYIEQYSGYLSFAILAFIGTIMIKNAVKGGGDEEENQSLAFVPMVLAAIATSIDAFAVGIVFSTEQINILYAASVIGLTTFTISVLGVLIGYLFNEKMKKSAEIVGGITLICIGLSMLIR